MHISFSEKRKTIAWQLSHVVDNRWLPLGLRARRFSLLASFVLLFKGFGVMLIFSSLRLSGWLFFLWFRDLTRERSYQGHHASIVQRGLKWGLIWFLFSEVFFFFRVFWTFFHFRLAPISGGAIFWPNYKLEAIPVFQVPLLNTVILLIRGVTATLAHQEILKGRTNPWVFISVCLGVYFLSLQGLEYFYRSFRISSGIFGRVFYFGTGFHGFHVCLGALMLLFRRVRRRMGLINGQHHFRLEFRLWYWHFVDVVWLFLFFWVYRWGRYSLINKMQS